MSAACCTICRDGSKPSGELITTCMPAVAPASSQELPMLQAPSPTKATCTPRQAALVLLDREQVGQQLAGVEVVGEGVDDRHAGVLRHLVELGLGVGAPHDRGRLPAEDPGDVGHRLAHADPGEATVDGHREAAQLGDAGGERGLGTQGRLVEDQRDGAGTGERLRCSYGACLSAPPAPAPRPARRASGRRRAGSGAASGRPPASTGRGSPGQAARNALGVGVGQHQRRRQPDRGRASGC